MNTEAVTPTPRRHTLMLWLFASVVACALCLHGISAALIDGVFIPADHDSFYHARRVLVALSARWWQVAQFDPRIHAPEGSWVTWPWAYDTLLALIAKSVMAVSTISQPLAVLDFVAPLAVFLSAALVLFSARELGLSFALQAIATVSFALATLTRELHRVGVLDHHYAEHIFVLATLYCGLRWCNALTARRRACALGVVLGVAPAFHNGDFILQLPVLFTLGLLWWRGVLPRASARTFAAALVTSTVLMLLPSEPFRLGMFSYTLHSWFHCYVACASSAATLWMAYRRPTRGNLMLGLGVGLVLVLPLAAQIKLGAGFLGARLTTLDRIVEAVSIPELLTRGDYAGLTSRYSAVLWLLPVLLLAVGGQARRGASPARVHFAVMAVFGATLMMLQGRLAYFGAFVLWLAPCACVAELGPRAARRSALAVFGALMLAAQGPGLARLDGSPALGGDIDYALLRSLYLELGRQCHDAPGVVLAEHDNGHYISFHSDCGVIADNFILTPQHEQKLLLVEQLMAGSLEQVLKTAPYVRYLLVQRADDPTRSQASLCFPHCAANAGLRHELLERVTPFPSRLHLLAEQLVSRDGRREPLARLFEVLPER